MRSFASRTFFGVRRLAAPRWSSAPHSDGHHFDPIGVSGSLSPPANSQRLTPVSRTSRPKMYGDRLIGVLLLLVSASRAQDDPARGGRADAVQRAAAGDVERFAVLAAEGAV